MNNDYVVLARKYRPTTINELKGQDVLVNTLRNAFNSNRIAHAFILSGVRGVGKTTTARILAKALNCVGENGDSGPTLNPCNKCENCISISSDKNLNVLEMDAASKTGIDDIREIIETVKYKPIGSRYKVYIIDEVHMLSKSAFNALLKTLEEPPPFVKFIFATTELKKVPITIISRCQRFDLKRLTPLEIKEHLSDICKNENISFENNALLLISNAAEGSVRDSLSLLDQAINISQGDITESIVSKLLGKGTKEDIFKIFNALVENNSTLSLQIFNNLYTNGIEVINIFEELLEICHLVTMLKISYNLQEDSKSGSLNPGTTVSTNFYKDNIIENLNLLDIEKNYAKEIELKVNLNSLIVLWQILIRGLEEIKNSIFPKKSADMLIIRITWIAPVATLNNLSSLLENKLNPNEINSIPKNENKEALCISNKPINSDIDNNKDNTVTEKETTEPDNFSKNNNYQKNNLTLDEIFELFPESQLIHKNK